MQKIIVKNNGPVKDIEFDIRKFNVLIGEQATGKSTIAKSIYFSRYVKTLISNYLIQVMENNSYDGKKPNRNGDFYKDIKDNLRDVFIQLFGYSWELDPKFYIKYEYSEDIWFEIKLSDYTDTGKKYISEGYSDELKSKVKILFDEAVTIFHDSQKEQLSLDLESESKTRNRKYILQRVNDIFKDNLTTYYIPAGRSLLTLLSASRASMNSLQNLDFAMNRFMELIDGVRGAYHKGVSNAHKYYPDGGRSFDVREIAKQIIDMQKGEYINTSAGEVLRVKGENNKEDEIKINFSSSGQQEILWLLNFLYVLMLRKERAFVIIEEPEAHIYPSLQKSIIEFITEFTNLCDSSVFITTHSPYVLTSMNNLYYAGGIVGSNADRSKDIYNIVNKNYIIDKDELTARKITIDQSYDLLKDDEGELSSYMIDDVSEKINEVYTGLYSIKENL